MVQSFFDQDPLDPDSPYGALCKPRASRHREARDFIEKLYTENHQFVGSDLRANARSQLGQSFWELYLAAALRGHGLNLVPRGQRHDGAGPDFQVEPCIWIEATAPIAGNGPDRVPDDPMDCQARQVPDDQIQLRYLSAINDKKRKFDGYIEKRLVKPTDPYVIALNGAEVSASGDFDPPRIVRMLFGLGWPIAHLRKDDGQIERVTLEEREAIHKKSGSCIPTTGFLSEALDCVSAVIFSLASPWNEMYQPGTDFLVVHNPRAVNKLKLGILPYGLEYRLEGNKLLTASRP